MSAAGKTLRSLSALDIIERTKTGVPLDEADLGFLCRGAVDGTVPDYQLAAWLMAVWFRGLNRGETLALTRAMVGTGEVLDWSGIDRPVVDKHSTGGVGDKTSLVLVPLIAAAGLAFAKMSGRGLGHTGGTLDKLESIPGFDVHLGPDALRAQVERIGCALVGQSAGLVPADGVLYALRDATRTVDSVPLIASSVMSKKLAAGAPVIVLDVKYGAGAFMAHREEAEALARSMVAIGTGSGRRVRAVMSPMRSPLGFAVGNAVEVREAIETLRGGGPQDLWELTLELGVQLLLLSGAFADHLSAAAELVRLRDSGAALEKFRLLVEAQGGDPRVVDDPTLLPSAPVVRTVRAQKQGWLAQIDPRTVAEAVLRLGGGRYAKGAAVDPAVGVRLAVATGDEVTTGDALAEIHARTDGDAATVEGALRDAFHLVAARTECPDPEHTYVID